MWFTICSHIIFSRSFQRYASFQSLSTHQSLSDLYPKAVLYHKLRLHVGRTYLTYLLECLKDMAHYICPKWTQSLQISFNIFLFRQSLFYTPPPLSLHYIHKTPLVLSSFLNQSTNHIWLIYLLNNCQISFLFL